MGRDSRVLIPGATYHVMNRGNRKERIYEDDRDRRRFLRIFIAEKERYGVDLLAGCPMGNHFHAIVNTPHGNLSDFMEQLEGQFAKYSNWRYGRVGHLFQGRFRGVLIEHDVHLLIALCYVFFNPLSAGLCSKPQDYRWSSYAATIGLAPCPSYLSIDWLLTLFPEATLEDAQSRFHKLMCEGRPVVGYLEQRDALVDPEALHRVIRSYTGEQLRLGMLPQMYRSELRSSLTELFPDGITAPARADAIFDAHVAQGYTLAEIARTLGICPQRVSQIYRMVRNSRRNER
jgi:putative transposase